MLLLHITKVQTFIVWTILGSFFATAGGYQCRLISCRYYAPALLAQTVLMVTMLTLIFYRSYHRNKVNVR